MGFGASKPEDVKSKYYPEFFSSLPRMDGKVVAITGSTTGTGYVCAKACAQLGATVLMLNRPSERADAAEKAIKADVPGSKVVTIPCDLSSFQGVRECAEKIKAEYGATGVDVLCNNAGVMALPDVATVDGCDIQMQTNHLSHFLLTYSLWGPLNKAASLRGEARVVNHSSIARTGPEIQPRYFEKKGGDLGGDGGWMPFCGPRWARYQQTKLANVVFTYALKDRLEKAGNSKIIPLVAHPGASATQLQSNSATNGGLSGLSQWLILKLSQSQDDGAMGIIKCCCAPGLKPGEFYGPPGQGVAGPADLLPEEKLATPASRDMLWEKSEETLGIKFVI